MRLGLGSQLSWAGLGRFWAIQWKIAPCCVVYISLANQNARFSMTVLLLDAVFSDWLAAIK